MTSFNLGFRTKLKLNRKQAEYFAKARGVARFSYNWALAEWEKLYEACKKDPSLPLIAKISFRIFQHHKGTQENAILREI